MSFTVIPPIKRSTFYYVQKLAKHEGKIKETILIYKLLNIFLKGTGVFLAEMQSGKE